MKSLIAAILIALLLVASSALAGLRLEAEAMTASHNLGGYDIALTGCSAASRGYAVDGLDVDGEWLQLRFTLDAPLCFVDSLRSAGDPGLVRRFALSLDPVPEGESGAPDTLTTGPGTGVSCNGTVFDWARSPVHCLGPGTYTLTVRRVGDGYTRLDYVKLAAPGGDVAAPAGKDAPDPAAKP